MRDDEALAAAALDVLHANDVSVDDGLGIISYTRPTAGLYPHQWNWDSAMAAIGWSLIDPNRAWSEMESLMAFQCPDGMLPHIAFNPNAESYSPGPEWWGSRKGGDGRLVSGLTQPPLAAVALRFLLEKTGEVGRARRLIPAIQHWHDWFLEVRDPDGRGEPVVVHPWESGRDNAVEWDVPLAAAPLRTREFKRVDTDFVASDHRPSDADYDRYLGLLETFETLGWDQARMASESPFRVLDPGFSAILAAACADLAQVAEVCDDKTTAHRAQGQSRRIGRAIDARRDEDGIAWPVDLSTHTTLKRPTCAIGLQLLQPVLPEAALKALAQRVTMGEIASLYGVCSTSLRDPSYQAENYWRGPVWAHITWLIALGLERHGRQEEADSLRDRIVSAVREGGFSEYFHPGTGDGYGGDDFSWTAAVALDSVTPRLPEAKRGHYDATAPYPCPCCGYLVHLQASGSFDICPICFWADDDSQLRDPTATGPHGPALLEAQRNFAEVGASLERHSYHARQAGPADRRDPGWRPFDPEVDSPLPPMMPILESYYWRRTEG